MLPWWCRWFCSDLTLAMRHSSVSQRTSWADCSLYSTPLHDLFYRGASMTTSHHSLELHCLRIEQRIEFKLSVLVFHCLNGPAPSYLSRDLLRVRPGGLPTSSFVVNRIRAFDWYRPRWPWMTLNSVIALILRFFTEFDRFSGLLCYSGCR